LAFGARADLEVDRIPSRPVDAMVTVCEARHEARSVDCLQYGRLAILDQHDLALEHVYELVFGLVPVTQGRGGARLESRKINPDVREPHDIAECSLLAAFG